MKVERAEFIDSRSNPRWRMLAWHPTHVGEYSHRPVASIQTHRGSNKGVGCVEGAFPFVAFLYRLTIGEGVEGEGYRMGEPLRVSVVGFIRIPNMCL